MDASVIIPTHNRRARLGRTLDALRRQDAPDVRREIIVVADGCTDDTAAFVAARAADGVRLVTLPGDGPAAARNAGAAAATGRLLLFLDDDITVDPGWLRAHCAAHAARPGGVVIGYLPLPPPDGGLFDRLLRHWWERMFDRMRPPGHRFAYDDLLTGNVSLSAELFTTVGGFDPTLRCHEDYEFGYRLHARGVPFAFAAAAVGVHHDTTDLPRALRRKFDEGVVDITLGERYPALRRRLPVYNLHHFSQRPSRALRHLAFHAPRVGDGIVGLVERTLPLWEAARLRGAWLRLVYGLLTYWYWRGVAQRLPSVAAVARFLAAAPPGDDSTAELTVDLGGGIAAAAALLDERRPAAVAVALDGVVFGRIPPQPGAERLHGRHLRHALATHLAAAYAAALQAAGQLLPVEVGHDA